MLVMLVLLLMLCSLLMVLLLLVLLFALLLVLLLVFVFICFNISRATSLITSTSGPDIYDFRVGLVVLQPGSAILNTNCLCNFQPHWHRVPATSSNRQRWM